MVIETKAVVVWEMGGAQDWLERGRRMRGLVVTM